MISYRDRTYCSRSYTVGGVCYENCYRLLVKEDVERANELGIPIAFSDFYGSDHCVLVTKDDEDDGK